MKVSRSMAYAVQALQQLAIADSKSPIPCNLLAREGQMPERFLLQILRTLVNNGLLNSIRGVEGGYVLAKPAADISLLDVFEAFDTPIVPSIPPLPSLSDYAREQMSQSMNRLAGLVRRELSQTSIADLLDPQAMPQPQGDLRPPLRTQPVSQTPSEV
ncbi:RrF2 family transcriptional regulator [Aeoliella sp.]|uniref:RrF2 family transcriptional regulator n=1 Tax=Aeoliella sp. TaxID=2795800 RepID=UPI003CCBBBB6